MVSTRGVKLKFSEGEKILCYEPDPTKAKVLYDSGVLQLFPPKESKGKKQIEYLIHFQGWNSSWDRRVPEDFVLKSTEENKELQKDLAESAKIKLSTKSNRVLFGPGLSGNEKKRKRRLSEILRDTIEEEKKNYEDSVILQESVNPEDELFSVSPEMNTSMKNFCNELNSESEEDVFSAFFPLVIPDALRAVVERDYHQINDKNKLLSLPSERPVLFILEDYVRYFASRFATKRKEKQKFDVKEKDKMFLTLNLCKEVMDSLRISFDFYLHTILLYKKELQQADNLKAAAVQHSSFQGVRPKVSPPIIAIDKDRKISKAEKEANKKEDLPRRYLRSKGLPIEEPVADVKETKPHSLQPESGRSTPTTVTSGGSTSGLYSLGEDDMAGFRQFRGISHLSQNWTLLPDAYRTPGTPVLIYGANHLLRLIVKLPEIMFKMKITTERKRIVLKHLDLILEYLNTHSKELFPESSYVSGMEM